MMTLILPGFASQNKTWLEEVTKQLKVDGDIRPVSWDHWEEPEKEFNPKDKARILSDIDRNKMVNIVAKSIGTLVASYIIAKVPDAINKIVFCGIPLNDLTEENKEDIKKALKNLPPEKIICFQNENDPHGSFDQVKIFFNDVNYKIEVISKNRDDHEYPYYDEFQTFLKN